MNKRLITIFLIFTFFLTSGFGCKLVDREVKEAMKPVVLNYWRVWDGPDAFEGIIASYQQLHPNITINYKKLRYEEYEQELLNALAEDRGPDIFSIHNTWVKKYENKLSPMPASITLAHPIVKGTIKKETITELRTTKSITLKEIRDKFVDVVYDDVVVPVFDPEKKETKDFVYGLPLSVDTLAMLYNRDLLNNAGIAQPPLFWNKEFQEAVKKLAKQNTDGKITQAGASLGGSANIERSSDILSVLMMQNGAEMVHDSKTASFNVIPTKFQGQNYNPGLEALRFYTDFANPAKEVYTWNSDMDNSLKLFAEGRLGITFGYAYHIPTIKSQAPKLNFNIAKLPQIEGNSQINFANYWIETVSAKSKYTDEAWDFIQFATKEEQAKKYLEATKKPTALKSLVAEQADDQDVGVFAEQVLTAKSWYRGYDSNAAEKIMQDMVNAVLAGQAEIDDIINTGAQRIQQTLSKPNIN